MWLDKCGEVWLDGVMRTTTTTHEEFIQKVRDIAVADALRREAISAEEADRLQHAKLVYGLGVGLYRGICHYGAWRNGVGPVEAIEIAATAEESWVQLAGTTIHELGHALAGVGAGHDKDWKDACVRLGFTKRPAAAGQVYFLSLIRSEIRRQVYELAGEIGDGSPDFARFGVGTGITVSKPRPCSQGHGTRGGTSRGKGSGSRQVKATCGCGRIIRASRSVLEGAPIRCEACGEAFEIEEAASDRLAA